MTAAGGDPARSAAAAVVAAPAASAGAAATPTAGAAAAAGPTAGAAAAAPTAGAAAAAGPTAGAAAAAGPTAAAADCPVFLSLHNHPAFTEDLLSHRFYGVDAPTRPPRVELVSKKFHLRPCGIPSARGSDHFGLVNVLTPLWLVPFHSDTLILKTSPTELRVAPSALPRAPCGHGRCS